MIDVSPTGVEFIRAFEKRSLIPYLDSAGKPTIGWGHLIRPGETYPPEGISAERAEAILQGDIQLAVEGVRRCFPEDELARHEADALVSFAFNLGETRLRESTLRRLLREGNRIGAAREFRRWQYETKGDKLVANVGLLRRRIAEELMFLGGATQSVMDLATRTTLR
jgi:lysozyme